MQANAAFWANRPVCVTGGAGFLGYHLVQQLRRLRARVRVFGLRPGPKHPLWTLADVAQHCGDIRDATAVRRAVAGCTVVFHTAGTVAAWGPAIELMMEVHLQGTRNVLTGLDEGARLVHTSSVVAVGASRRDELLDEDSRFNLEDVAIPYVHAKRGAEELVRAEAERRDVVVVNPGYLLGPDDHEGSVMGRLCVRAWKGRVPLAPPGGLNLVDVRDVALGHLLAAERGARGRRYILGGENHRQRAFLRQLAEAAGYRPRLLWTVPRPLLFAVAYLAELHGRWSGREPYPSLGQARLSQYHWFYRSDRAAAELGYTPRPLAETLVETHAWYEGQQLLRPRGVHAWLLRAGPRRAA